MKERKTHALPRPAAPFFGNHQFFNTIQRQPAPATAPPANTAWADFTAGFNNTFRSVLHAFNPGWEPDAKRDAPGTQSADALDEAQLQALFTETQRDKLLDFFSTKQIPDRLFNGDETGNLNAHQRLLLSTIILSTGKYQPGSFEQKVHARMCFHWAHITHHYAGITSAGLNKGIMGSFDHAGNIVFGQGSSEDVFMGSKVSLADLPEKEEGGIGPIPADTDHKAEADKEEAELAADPKAGRKIHRRKTLPFEDFSLIQPGDWIWYYNANASASGSHSVLFSRWASGVETVNGIRYRKAIAFSQPKPERGGREHVVYLGEQPYRDGNFIINPITYLNRVSASAKPATTVDELLPQGKPKTEAALETKNERFMKQAAKKFKKTDIDQDALKSHMREENNGHITALSHRLTEGQIAMLNEANATDDLETLIRLVQRLRSLKNNMDIYEANMYKTFDMKLNDKHAEAVAKLEEKEAGINEKVGDIDLEMAGIAENIEEITADISDKDLDPQIKELRKKADKLRKELKKKDADKDAIKQAIEDVKKEIKDLEAKARALRPELKQLRGKVKQLSAQSKRLQRSKDKLQAELAKQSAALPFGLVHPGALGKEDKRKVNGQLEYIFTAKQLEQFTK